MFKRALILELGNDKSIFSPKNARKLFFFYVLPNISAFFGAIVFSQLPFFNPLKAILTVIAFNLIWILLIQFFAQLVVCRKLEKEAIIKFIPEKATQFVKIRLALFFTKGYFPLALFTVIFIGFFGENKLASILLLLFTSLVLLYIQIHLAIMIRYMANTLRAIYLHTIRISLFIIGILSIWAFQWFTVPFVLGELEALARYEEGVIHPSLHINLTYIMITFSCILILAIFFSVITKRMLSNTLIHNRNVTLNIKTTLLEKWHYAVYKYRLSNMQRIIFNNDIKVILRNSKVAVVFFALHHLITFSMLTFFFLSIKDFHEPEMAMFISKFYLVIIVGQTVLAGFIGLFQKEYIPIENDQNVLNSYHIYLPKHNIVQAKARIFDTFFFPKVTVIYTVLVVTSLILAEWVLVGYLLINYIQCFLFIKLCGLIVTKMSNNLNSKSELLNFAQYIMLAGFIALFGKLLTSPVENYSLFLAVLLGATMLVYLYNLFIFKDFKQYKTEGGLSNDTN